MAGVLHSEKMDKIDEFLNDAFDINSNVVYFPVRHHSPTCSYHLKKVIEEYNPEAILIEGPSNANKILSLISHQDTKPPISIYYSFKDSTGVLGEKDKKFICNYPFLSYSPEYNAIVEGAKKEIKVEFIDLPYEEMLFCTKGNIEDELITQERLENSKYDYDYFVEKSQFIKRICEKMNCRDFHEFWEKTYEINGLYLETKEFLKDILSYCYLSRLSYTEEELYDEGCISRELYMKAKIQEAKGIYKKILVVSGGFHTWGLINLNDEYVYKPNVKRGESSSYLIPFSFEESDSLHGYKSGMPYVAYYNRVWEHINTEPSKAYYKTTEEFIGKCGQSLRKAGESISISDSIEANNMSRGLAYMRDKKDPGVYELIDGIRSSFIKGEFSIYNNKPLKILNKLIIGNNIGHVTFNEYIPPIVVEFRETCKKLKLDISTSTITEKVLNVHKTKLHKSISIFFHRLSFLECNFCTKKKGADYVNRKDINLKREVWEYRWTSLVEGALIEKSVYGTNIEEACIEILIERLISIENHSREATKLMIFSILMEIDDASSMVYEEVKRCIENDSDFESVMDSLKLIDILLNEIYLMEEKYKNPLMHLMKLCVLKGIYMVNHLKNTSKDQENRVIDRIKLMNNVVIKNNWSDYREIMEEEFISLAYENKCNSAIKGAVLGILLGFDRISKEDIEMECDSYFLSIGEERLESANFLKGLFSTAKDIVLVNNYVIHSINKMMKDLSYHEFMTILPELRLAFSYFTPIEISKIGEIVGALFGKGQEEILLEEAVSEELISLCTSLNKMAKAELGKLIQ